MKSVSLCILPLLSLTLYANEEISVSPFNTLTIRDNQQVKVLPGAKSKIVIIGKKDRSFIHQRQGNQLYIGDDNVSRQVNRPYRLEVYTSQPLEYIKVSTYSQAQVFKGAYSTKQLTAKVSTNAQLDIPEGTIETFNIKTSTNGVFGQHSEGLCVSHVQGQASTHSTLHLPETQQGKLKCSTLANCFVKSFDRLEVENSTCGKIGKVE